MVHPRQFHDQASLCPNGIKRAAEGFKAEMEPPSKHFKPREVRLVVYCDYKFLQGGPYDPIVVSDDTKPPKEYNLDENYTLNQALHNWWTGRMQTFEFTPVWHDFKLQQFYRYELNYDGVLRRGTKLSEADFEKTLKELAAETDKKEFDELGITDNIPTFRVYTHYPKNKPLNLARMVPGPASPDPSNDSGAEV